MVDVNYKCTSCTCTFNLITCDEDAEEDILHWLTMLVVFIWLDF